MDNMDQYDSELDQDDADAVAEAQAEVKARAQAFQTWWSGPFGDNYRHVHMKVSKSAVRDAFYPGWTAVVDALAAMDNGEDSPYDLNPDDLGDA